MRPLPYCGPPSLCTISQDQWLLRPSSCDRHLCWPSMYQILNAGAAGLASAPLADDTTHRALPTAARCAAPGKSLGRKSASGQKSTSHPTSRRQSSQTAPVSTVCCHIAASGYGGSAHRRQRQCAAVDVLPDLAVRSGTLARSNALASTAEHGSAAPKTWLNSQALRRRIESLTVLLYPTGPTPPSRAAAHRRAVPSSRPIFPHASTHCRLGASIFW